MARRAILRSEGGQQPGQGGIAGTPNKTWLGCRSLHPFRAPRYRNEPELSSCLHPDEFCGSLPARAVDILRRDYDAWKPQDAAIKNTEFVLVTDIGLELGGELVSRPTTESKSVGAGEDWVFGCPLLDGLGVNCRGGQMIHNSNNVCWNTVIRGRDWSKRPHFWAASLICIGWSTDMLRE